MKEHISELVAKIGNILSYLKLYDDAERMLRLALWLRGQDVPDDI